MQEPSNRGNQTALTLIKVLLISGLSFILFCGCFAFFIWGLCAAKIIKVEQARPAAPIVSVQ